MTPTNSKPSGEMPDFTSEGKPVYQFVPPTPSTPASETRADGLTPRTQQAIDDYDGLCLHSVDAESMAQLERELAAEHAKLIRWMVQAADWCQQHKRELAALKEENKTLKREAQGFSCDLLSTPSSQPTPVEPVGAITDTQRLDYLLKTNGILAYAKGWQVCEIGSLKEVPFGRTLRSAIDAAMHTEATP